MGRTSAATTAVKAERSEPEGSLDGSREEQRQAAIVRADCGPAWRSGVTSETSRAAHRLPAVQAGFYRDSGGTEPVDAFISALEPEVQEEVDYTISLLNRLSSDDPPLPFPFSSQVQGQLRE